MKKIITFMCVFIFFVMPINVYADSATVEVIVNGEVKKGSTIDILVNVKDVDKFYAASVDFTYDTNQLKVESINASEFITKHSSDIMELGGETDKNGNTASYSFTFLGEREGIKGSGTVATITAQVLNDEKLSIGQEAMKVKLVHRVGDTVENYSYKFSGYNVSTSTNTPNTGNKPDNNVNNDSTTTESGAIDNSNTTNKGDSNQSVNSDNGNKSEDDSGNESVDSSKDNSSNTDDNVDTEAKDNEDSNNKEDSSKTDEVKDTTLLSNKNNSTVWKVVLGIVVIAALGGVGYYVYSKKKNSEG